jgi:PAS domain S-box-containing protein
MAVTRYLEFLYPDEADRFAFYDISLFASTVLLTLGLFLIVKFFKQMKALEERSKLNTQQLTSLVTLSDDAIITKKLDGTILSWNPGAEKIFGYSASEVIGKSIFIIVPDERRDEEFSILDAIARGERVRHLETERLHRDGRVLVISISTSPIKDTDGNVIAASKIGRDVTERKNADEKLKRTAQQLAISNRDLEQFAAIASHDLKSPLNTIAGYLGLLERTALNRLDDRERASLKAAKAAAMRMGELLNHLLEFSKLTAPSKSMQPVDFEKALDDALANLNMVIEARKPIISHDQLPTIKGYHIHIVRLFQNLVGNALKYCNADRPKIHVACDDKQDQFIISVADNGIGFEMKDAKRVFNLFERLHSDDKFPGSGLGLAVCQRIVERQGGRIWAHSSPGKGSTFYFSLPKTLSVPIGIESDRAA